MRLKLVAIAVLGTCVLHGAALAAEVRVLSAAAVTPGLRHMVELYRARSGHAVTVSYANGPEIQQRIGSGERGFDVVVAPEGVLAALAARGSLPSEPTPLGRVGIGAAVKPGAPRPDISDPAALERSLLAAKSVIISRGSTGVYLEGLFQRTGVMPRLGERLVRAQNGGAVVERVLAGDGAEIALTAQTELELGRERGLVLLGPLPEAVQNYTAYAAVAFPDAMLRPEVAGFVALLKSPEAKAVMVANGID